MLELYHSVNSVCAQKVRVALLEKGLEATEHLMTLRGDHLTPEYLRLNPNGVVPTLVHDGRPVIESSVILYYLDEAFPQPPLMPADAHSRATVRLYNKLIDEYVHNYCTVLSFATAFRPQLARLAKEELEAMLAKAPIKKRSEYKRDVVAHGLESHYVTESIEYHQKLLAMMEKSLKSAQHLAGDAFTLADAAVIPYIIRLDLLKLSGMWEHLPGVARWYERVRTRPSVQQAIYNRMTDADWAPFRNLELDPWPKVRTLLKAA
jgi:glutathione S-transferase